MYQSGEGVLYQSEILYEEYRKLCDRDNITPIAAPVVAPTITRDDLLDLAAIVRRLRRALPPSPDGLPADEVSVYLVRLLTDSEKSALRAEADNAAPVVLDCLNRAIEQRLDAEPSFATFTRNSFIQDLIARGAPRPLIGRLLLEAAFAQQIARMEDIRLAPVIAALHALAPAALCLSGGGIRSASFALGVVQGLARAEVLDKFHYLSTVSGGGYLGGWLTAWMHRASPADVLSQLANEQSPSDPEPRPIAHLRAYSNYLSPRLGALSGDTWTLVAIYLRNLLLNWLVLFPLVATVAFLPRLFLSAIRTEPPSTNTWIAPAVLASLAFLFGVAAVTYVHRYRSDQSLDQTRRRTAAAFARWCFVPLTLCAMLLAIAYRWATEWHVVMWSDAEVWIAFVGFGAAMHLFGWVIAGARPRRVITFVAIIASGGVTGAIARVAGHGLRYVADLIFASWPFLSADAAYSAVSFPAFLGLIMLAGYFYTGVSSARESDGQREWMARFSAWLLLAMFVWMLAFALVLLGPRSLNAIAKAPQTEATLVTLTGSVLTTVLGVGSLSGVLAAWLGASSKTPAQTSDDSTTPSLRVRATGFTLGAAACVFIACAVIWASDFGGDVLDAVCHVIAGCHVHTDLTHIAYGLHLPERHYLWVDFIVVLVATIALGAIATGFAFVIDTNKFSLHAMYRARLTRAFLGASRPSGERQPDRFTGFDERDDLPLDALWPATEPDSPVVPPLHVVNMTLNDVAGTNLAWQQRKAEPFTATALHAGAARVGYRRTSHSARRYGGPDGMTLGTAMTISGAAASPNMGYHSSPAITLIMTLFNARLGVWLGNPGGPGDDTFDRAYPRATPKPIIQELLGQTTDTAPYVYLSDGGHFENLGLYEMVRRRCRTIVVVDASGDPHNTGTELGNTVRKIRIDLGIPIDFTAGRRHKSYWRIGHIRYACIDPGNPPDGVLLYVKPAIIGNEPADVLAYRAGSPTFPHETTADQFFTESQLESYRMLGAHIIAQTADERSDGTLAWLGAQVQHHV